MSHFLNKFIVGSILMIVITVSALGLSRCGRPKVTSSPSTPLLDGLPGDWDGNSDYESDGWRFETP